MKLEAIARLCHGVNQAICVATDDPIPQVDWDVWDAERKMGLRKAVTDQLTNPVLTPEESHTKWLEYMRAQDWQYGEVYDVKEKTHPCMVPYSQLPMTQRIKDQIFLAIVNTCAFITRQGNGGLPVEAVPESELVVDGDPGSEPTNEESQDG